MKIKFNSLYLGKELPSLILVQDDVVSVHGVSI